MLSGTVSEQVYRVFQKFVPIVYCILRKAFNTSLGKCTVIRGEKFI